ncbi:radical SAM/SPASM domain-containing protein [Thermodesulfobacteriota bacterium]
MTSSVHMLSLAGQLLYNGGRYCFQKGLRLPGKIQALSLEITHRCICQCIMCNIWKIPHQVNELNMSDWAEVLESPSFTELVELDITGGEPFLKRDLNTFFDKFKSLKQKHLTKLKSIAITTNAILTHRVLETTEAILRSLEGTGIQLVLVCAMDAVDDLHDRIRNYPGAFEKMQTTLAGLMELRERFPKLILGLKTTIVPANVNQLPDIDHFARSHGLFAIISPCIITGGRYLNHDRSDEMAFNDQHINQMIHFFSREDLQWSYHARTLNEYLLTGRSHRRCSCGLNYAFIRSTGAVHLCPLLPESVGSVRQDDFESIWRSATARSLRGCIGNAEPCLHCTEPGLERYSLYYEGWVYLKMLLQMGSRRFEQFHMHMGLDNYFQ